MTKQHTPATARRIAAARTVSTNPLHRATSVYTMRLTTADDVRDAAEGLTHGAVIIADHGDTSVSFRAADDMTAERIADLASDRAWTLTTGLGIHRRHVAANPGA